MKSLLWQHLPCNDDQAAALAAALGRAPDRRAAAVPARARRRRTSPRGSSIRRSITCTIRSCSPTWTAAVDAARAGAGATRERIADPRRLRRRRHHLDRHPAPRARDARRRRRALHPRAPARRLRPAAGRPSSGCTPKASTLIVSVDCGIRGTEAARRARELGVDLIITDHHEPDGTLPAGARGHQSEAPRLHAIPTSTSPASASR